MNRLIVTMAICVAFAGCGINRKFVTAVDKSSKPILEEYSDYVKNDQNLSEDDKKYRRWNVEGFRNLIQEALTQK